MEPQRQLPTFSCLVAFISVLVFSTFVWAQASTSVRGTVSDPTGALIRGAGIRLENLGTSAVWTTVADNNGTYHFPQLPPGTYRIRAEMDGFKSVVRENLQLLVNTPMTLNLKFEETGLTIEVNVTATRLPSINSVDATMGNTIESSQIVALPLEARNAIGLLSLQPGVVYTGINDKVIPDTRGGAVAGARSDQTNVTLDGIDVNDQQTGEAFKSVVPITLDSVQEFRFITSDATANLGRSSGGQVSMITRSGTNVLHGSAYEYHRNTLTSANSFFNNSTINPVTGKTLERPKLIRNVFGAALGGPIQRNRLFFFLNFEDTITRWEEPQLRIVPSSTLRQGILQYRDTSDVVRRITPGDLQGMDPLGVGVNAAVLALLQQYPLGNDPTQGGDGALNFVGFRFNAPLNEDKPSYIARIDYTSANNRHSVFARGALADFREDDRPPQFPGQTPARILLTNSKGTAIAHTWSINPKLISAFHWGFTRQGLDLTGASTSPGLHLVGIDNLRNYDDRNSSRKLPTHNVTEDVTWTLGRHVLQMGVNFRNIHNKRFTEQQTYAFYHSNPSWMKNLGRDVLPDDITANFRTPYVRGQMALLGTISQVDVTYFVNRNGSIFPSPYIPRREFINNEFEWYAQDQWKFLRNLTLTVGLRYSYFAPPYEENGLQVRANFDVNEWFANRQTRGAAGIPSSANPLLSFIPAGKANNAPTFFDPDRNNFAPRVAIAWNPSYATGVLHTLFGNAGQSSIRFGGAMFYDRTGGTYPITADLTGAVGLATLLRTPTGAFNYGTAPRFTGPQNLTSIPVPSAPRVGFPATLDIGAGGTGFMVDTKLRTPYATTLNFSISRALPGDLTIETAYVGRIGRKLLVQNDFAGPLVNFKDPKSGQTWTEAAGLIADLIDRTTPVAQIPRIPFIENVFAPMGTSTMSASAAFYSFMLDYTPSWLDGLHDLDTAPGGSTIYGPYTFFQQQFDWLPGWTNLGQSSYHSFQLSIRKRFSHGLQADFNYTLAKALDNGSAVESEGQGAGQIVNAFDHRQSLSFSNFDIRHQVNSNFVLDLPVGRGRRFGEKLTPAVERILGGWRMTGLLRWRTGFPFPSSSGNGFAFPTNYFINGPPTLKPGVPLPEINVTKDGPGGPNIFADPAKAYDSFQYTRSGFSGSRNALHGPGFFTLDTGVQKTFNIRERQELQFRWETFNLTNTVNFDGRVYPVGSRGIDFDLDAKPSFGQLRTLAGNPRIMQFALRYQF
jgi:Carboxypeptidase regulatory-like domain/TonB dependent receptor